jgi:hypothetical protein
VVLALVGVGAASDPLDIVVAFPCDRRPFSEEVREQICGFTRLYGSQASLAEIMNSINHRLRYIEDGATVLAVEVRDRRGEQQDILESFEEILAPAMIWWAIERDGVAAVWDSAPLVEPGMHTPWGKALTVSMWKEGIGWVSTARHGGIKLSVDRNACVPEYMRNEDGWYEEDEEHLIVQVVFEKELCPSDSERVRDNFQVLFPEAAKVFFSAKPKVA